MRNAKSAGVLYACKGVHTIFIGQRKREREGERDVEYVQNFYFYFLKE
jgi:hypothetical protein